MSVRMKRRKAKADHLSQGKPHEFMINSKIGVVHISQCLESIKSLIFNFTLFLAQKNQIQSKANRKYNVLAGKYENETILWIFQHYAFP